MLPKVILHNSISIDGSLTSFEPHMELHYRIAGMYKPEMHLIGSHTIATGVELYETGVPPEQSSDFTKPHRDKALPYWAVVDSKGKLEGMLHTCRRFDMCRDVIVLVSKKTPKRYLRYLDKRHYDYYSVGTDCVDLRKALERVTKEYQVRTILADTGRVLGNLLLMQGLVDEISLLIHPVIVGKTSYNMFSDIQKNLDVTLVKHQLLEKQYVWLVYQVQKKAATPRLR